MQNPKISVRRSTAHLDALQEQIRSGALLSGGCATRQAAQRVDCHGPQAISLHRPSIPHASQCHLRKVAQRALEKTCFRRGKTSIGTKTPKKKLRVPLFMRDERRGVPHVRSRSLIRKPVSPLPSSPRLRGIPSPAIFKGRVLSTPVPARSARLSSPPSYIISLSESFCSPSPIVAGTPPVPGGACLSPSAASPGTHHPAYPSGAPRSRPGAFLFHQEASVRGARDPWGHRGRMPVLERTPPL